MNAIGTSRQSGAGLIAIVIGYPCPENKVKNYCQWQATDDSRKARGNGMPFDATPHEIKGGTECEEE